MKNTEFWENVYQTKEVSEVSWQTDHLLHSLELIRHLCPNVKAPIIDVGSGRATLVDDLIAFSYSNINILDISPEALKQTRQRLNKLGHLVNFHLGNVLTYQFENNSFDLWHDRAVFHFLTKCVERKAYKDNLRKSVKKGGYFLISCFDVKGPSKCSGLKVIRYNQISLKSEFENDFYLMGSKTETHTTPFGTQQQFINCWFRKK